MDMDNANILEKIANVQPSPEILETAGRLQPATMDESQVTLKPAEVSGWGTLPRSSQSVPAPLELPHQLFAVAQLRAWQADW